MSLRARKLFSLGRKCSNTLGRFQLIAGLTFYFIKESILDKFFLFIRKLDVI